MKSFLIRAVLFATIQIAIVVVVVALYHPSDRHYLASTLDKHRLLESTPSPRLILVGGSSLPFGVQCDTLAARLPYHPINMGIHAALGSGFMLREAVGGIRAGDVVVVSLEYELFNATCWPDILLRLLESRPRGWADVPAEYYPTLLDYGLSYAGVLTRGSVARLRGRPEPLTGAYVRDAFDAFGDDTLRPPTDKLPPLETEILPQGRFTRQFATAVRQLNAFDAECRRRGARAYFAYPIVPETRYRVRAGQLRRMSAAIERDVVMPRLDAPEDEVMADSLFYDTEYHLKNPGVALHSRALAIRLAARLARDGGSVPAGAAR